MVIDIYAAKSNGEITILHDRPFAQKPTALEFDPAQRHLWFVSDEGRKPYGTPIRRVLVRYLREADSVTFFQMDRATKKKPVGSFTVPLRLQGVRPSRFRRLRRRFRWVAPLVQEGTYRLWVRFFPGF